MHVASPVLTETARSCALTGAAITPGTVAQNTRETTKAGFDGALYLQQPPAGTGGRGERVCNAQLPVNLGSAQSVVRRT